MRYKRVIHVVLSVLCIFPLFLLAVSFCAAAAEKIPVRVLLLPKFEVDELSGDFPGEAQYYYDAYLTDGDEYEIPWGYDTGRLYVKDGVALAVTGMGKVNAALTTMAILTDERFDFSDAYVISTGCAGSARDTTVMGDVFVITAAVNYDLGHHADIREMENDQSDTWFHDEAYDAEACIQLDSSLMDKVFELVKDTPVQTTPKTRSYMSAAFDAEEWAVRDPMVMCGTTVTSDNYWKGSYDHQNALTMIDTYDCPDPYVTTEMEDIAIAQTMQRMGMLDRLIILRDSVNMDVFMLGNTPESLWAPEQASDLASDDNVEAADIFGVAMENNYKVGSRIIDAILNNEF